MKVSSRNVDFYSERPETLASMSGSAWAPELTALTARARKWEFHLVTSTRVIIVRFLTVNIAFGPLPDYFSGKGEQLRLAAKASS